MPRETQLSAVERYFAWFGAQASIVGGIAWLAFQLQQDRFAPAVIFPLAVGVALGIPTLAISRATDLRRRRPMCAAAFVSGLLVVVAQDYIGHRHRLRAYADNVQRHSPVAETLDGRPAVQTRFTQYLASQVRDEPLWWTLDAVLTSGAALTTVVAGLQRNPTNRIA